MILGQKALGRIQAVQGNLRLVSLMSDVLVHVSILDTDICF